MEGSDTIGQAQSGTGKTATFVIGALQRVDFSKRLCQTLMLAPTRELADQIYRVVIALGDYLHVRAHICIGGKSIQEDSKQLRSGQHVVVGTPGRVFDMIGKGHLRTDDLLTFICDEADEMLSRGFKDQIYNIFKTLPSDVQVCLFSATMDKDVLDLTDKFMRNAVRILVKKVACIVTVTPIAAKILDCHAVKSVVHCLLDMRHHMPISVFLGTPALVMDAGCTPNHAQILSNCCRRLGNKS